MLTARLILERFDKDGRLLERKEQPSRSFVRGFIQLLYIAHAQIQFGAPYSMTDIDGNARNIDGQSKGSAIDRYTKGNLIIGSAPGSAGVFVPITDNTNAYFRPDKIMIVGEKIGIVVGTGVNAVAPTDNALQTRILHGTQAGRFEYGGCELINIAFADPNGSFDIRRYFTNKSGGVITVNEVGIYVGATQMQANDCYAWPFCIARDLVAGGQVVNNNELLRVTYTVQITV